MCLLMPTSSKGAEPPCRCIPRLGYFQFGGSTHCLVFQKGVIDKFDVEKEQDVKMGSLIARIK